MEHWKSAINPDYLGAYSLDDGNNGYVEKNGIIIRVEKRETTGQDGKKMKLIAQTSLGKPLILNATNRDVLIRHFKTNYYELWQNMPVTFYVERNCRSPKGGTTDGLRIKPQSTPVIDMTKQIKSLRDCKTIEELQKAYLSLNKQEQIALVAVKDEMKGKLS